MVYMHRGKLFLCNTITMVAGFLPSLLRFMEGLGAHLSVNENETMATNGYSFSHISLIVASPLSNVHKPSVNQSNNRTISRPVEDMEVIIKLHETICGKTYLSWFSIVLMFHIVATNCLLSTN